MSDRLTVVGLVMFLVFCRIGGCVLFAPGLSSARIPMQIRLLMTVSIALALMPILLGTVRQAVGDQLQTGLPALIATESIIGSAIGLMGRLFLLALQFSANVISSTIGLAGIPGVPLDEAEAGSPLSSLMSSMAVLILLILGLHVEMLRAIVDSYRILPPGEMFSAGLLAGRVLEVLSQTFFLALRLGGPFIAYGIIVNMSVGLANRFAPHVSVYYATTGAVILGGFGLLLLLIGDVMVVFVAAYESWLARGGF